MPTALITLANGEQIVRGPRVTDAIGQSLRRAFAAPRELPGDLVTLLRRLGPDRHRWH